MNRFRRIPLLLLFLLSVRVVVAGQAFLPAGTFDNSLNARCRILPERALSCCGVPLATPGTERDCDCDLREVDPAYPPLERNPHPRLASTLALFPLQFTNFRDSEALDFFIPNLGTPISGPPRARLQSWRC